MSTLEGLTAENLTLARGAHLLFRDLNFGVASGEVLSVEGPNGAGKTSLLRAVAGFLELRAGSISLRENDKIISDAEERGKFVGWLGHHDGIKPQLTPLENLRFFSRFFRGGADIGELLQRAGLRRVRDLPVQYLSAGQKKRLAFARLLLTDRPLWLLDEPLSSLDAAGRVLVAELMDEHCRSGGIAIAATHEPLGVPCRQLLLGAA